MTDIITYISPRECKIDLTPEQIRQLQAAGVWPRDFSGEEYCRVSHGLHAGTPTLSDTDIELIIKSDKQENQS